ncbi:GNAT family N-acetyltransferase [Nocardia sienata]|uniref:GNAT family N-acetyltransferase n=1 Tax=Nocardia sienata TaxID=248552 RepID=UPI0007A42C89|nr:GNAT family N-acetyltransferase [Nocardia sienata]
MSNSSHTDPAAIGTARLILRLWTPDDLTAVRTGVRAQAWAADFPADGDREIVEVLAVRPHWLDRFGHRMVSERGSGLVVGSIGLFWPPVDGVLELGYGIVPSRRGRGYATEATRALADYALTAPGVHTVSASVELVNPASVRVLEKAGFARVHSDGARAEFRLTRSVR